MNSNLPLSIFLALVVASSFGACASDPAFDGGADAADTTFDADAAQSDVAQDDMDSGECGAGEVRSGNPCDCEGVTVDASDALCERDCDCAGGFWSCEESCQTPDPLAFALEGPVEVNEAVGDGDGLLQPGETGEVVGRVLVSNAPEEGVTVDARLRSFGGDLATSEDSEARFESVTEAIDLVLRFEVEENASAGPATLQLDVTSGFIVLEETIAFAIEGANRPELRWSEPSVERVEGNVNRDIEAGETWQVVATLENRGDRAADALEVGARASSATLELEEQGVGVPAGLDAGESQNVRWRFVVSEALQELVPVVTLSASGPETEAVSVDVEVALTPPDTLVIGDARFEGDEPAIKLVVAVENGGGIDVTGLSWSRIVYASPTPCGGPEQPACEEPFVEAMPFGEPVGPSAIAAGGSAEVVLPLAVTPDTPRAGRVLLRATSDLRSHGPYPLDVER